MEYAASVPTPYSLHTAESGTAGWTVNHSGGTKDWAIVTTANNHSPTRSWFATNLTSTSSQHLLSTQIVIRTGSTLSFWHAYDLEAEFDGGVVEISTNTTAGPWRDIGSNVYDAVIATGYSSPIAGRKAFTGSNMTVHETRIDLAAYAGRSAYFRFRLACDSSAGETGWWVDDVGVGEAATWMSVGVSTTGTTYYPWTVPMVPGSNYCVRVQLTGPGCSNSLWGTSGEFIVSADTDGDRIPDAWETQWFGDLVTATTNSDTDKDGFSDGNEYHAHTDPTTNVSLLIMGPLVVTNAQSAFMIRWSSVSNRFYSVDRSTNLTDGFSGLVSNLPASPPTNQYTDTTLTDPPGVFYRIRLDR